MKKLPISLSAVWKRKSVVQLLLIEEKKTLNGFEGVAALVPKVKCSAT